MSKNLDETVRLQSEKGQEWIREKRGERLQGMQRAQVAHSSSAALFPRRNECPGTHCSLIEQEEKEVSSGEICHRDSGKRKDGEEDRTRVT